MRARPWAVLGWLSLAAAAHGAQAPLKFPASDAKTGCAPEQRAAAERALLGDGKALVGARDRAAEARRRLDSPAPLCPEGARSAAAERVCRATTELFEPGVKKFDLLARLAAMEKALSGTPDVRCAPPKDARCKGRKGFVEGRHADSGFVAVPVLWLCPLFFSAETDDDERARSLLHEAAHLAGAADKGPEAYCLVFDCETACGGKKRSWTTADTWAQYADCLAGRSPSGEGLRVTGD